MTVADLGALIRGVAPAMRDYVRSTLQPVEDRVAILEDHAPVVAGPPGEKGADGINGRDGTIENLKMTFDGERTVKFCFKNGDPIDGGVITFPVEIYRGVYQDGKSYDLGDGVTWGGSEWHCNEHTTAKPGDGSKAWTLKVKQGREGRPGKNGKDGGEGKPGKDWEQVFDEKRKG